MIKWIYFFLLIIFQTFICFSQTVTNAVSRQEQSSIIISYNLETTSPCKISLYVSTNGGISWDGPLKKVKGDVGDKISSGEHSIIWSVLEEYKEFRGDNIKFQVRAESGSVIYIGNQVWTTSNLNVSTYRNGDIIPEVNDIDEWINLTSGAWCYYKNKSKNGTTYGKLYNWYAVNDSRGLAPVGYHIPSDSEWVTLTTTLGANSGAKMKSAFIWNNGVSGSNSSGFTGLPNGGRFDNGTFNNFGDFGYFWSSTEGSNEKAWLRGLYFNTNYVYSYNYNKVDGFSVRCIRD